MNALTPCPSCLRHVRVAESTCPFCGVLVTLDEAVPRGIYAQRLGRAALFTFGTAIATTAGCATATTPTDASAGGDVGLDGGDVADVGHDAYYGSIGDVYGAPDVGFLYDAGPADAGADEDAAELDAGIHAPYGAPPPPPEPDPEP
jgi:hypothetical protein